MSIPASAQLLATCRAMRTMMARDQISVSQGKLREDKAQEFAAAMEASYETLQRALADALRRETT